jgi:hypothetical protein
MTRRQPYRQVDVETMTVQAILAVTLSRRHTAQPG